MLSSCGRGASPAAPSAPAVAPTAPEAVALRLSVPGTGAGQPSVDASDEVSYLETQGAYPEGFLPKFRVTPKPGADGVIHGESPLEVEFDLCGSTADAGKTLHFLFDWSFDHVADVVGTGDACHQKHRYRVPESDAKGEKTLRTNVCVANADPRGDTSGGYISCRQYTISLPIPKAAAGRDCIVTFGGSYTECLTGRLLEEDFGNDGSFERSWIIVSDAVPGIGGGCPAGTFYAGDVSASASQTDFIDFLASHGITLTDNYCGVL
jgi:hypothetical protein